MSTHKHFDKICCVVLALTLILTVVFMNARNFGVVETSTDMQYENKIFDTSAVHTLDIVIDDWEEFLSNCQSEEYYNCAVVIDNEAFKNVAIRGKGNTSLSMVPSYGNDRYSFKIEFDHYEAANTYYGLDKLCLNNIIQDNTYMKDYLTYQMMREMGVAAPLCSFIYITVNGEDWGLYLAVEGVEESFLKRNYGTNYGELYKPDSMNMGGGRGNGGHFNMDEFIDKMENGEMPQMPEGMSPGEISQMPEGMPPGEMPQMPEGMAPGEMPQMPQGENHQERRKEFGGGRQEFSEEGKEFGGRGGMGMHGASDDVLLKYIDDEIESYANIFDSAKTNVTDADKNRLISALEKLSDTESATEAVDMEAVIRYFVVHNFVLNFDSYTGGMIHNYYLYEKEGKMQMIPWDYNLAFGSFQSAGGDATSLVNYPIDSPVSGGDTSERPMIAWIFENEAYTELYHSIFQEFMTTCFDNGMFEAMFHSVTEMIAPYVEKDPTKFCTYEDFQKGVATLKEFCLLRAESVNAQLDGTIGTTTETQDEETFIDAGNLQINDMGSMGHGMGGGRGMRPN